MIGFIFQTIVKTVTVEKWTGFKTCSCGSPYCEADDKALRERLLNASLTDDNGTDDCGQGTRIPCSKCSAKTTV